MKKILILGVVCMLGILGGYQVLFAPHENIESVPKDHKNISYQIAGTSYELTDGVSEVEQPNSSAKISTRYFGNEIKIDLNDDGKEDVFFLLTQDGAGSGTYFYGVAALTTPSGLVGSEAVWIGDRISPQSTNLGPKNTIIVNYADRVAGEPFTTPPSVAKSVYLLYDKANNQFGEAVQNFEGESDR